MLPSSGATRDAYIGAFQGRVVAGALGGVILPDGGFDVAETDFVSGLVAGGFGLCICHVGLPSSSTAVPQDATVASGGVGKIG